MSKRFRSGSLLALMLLLIPVLIGCGSGNKEGAAQITVAPAQLAGADACINCHPNQKLEWEVGGHANLNGTPSLASVGEIGGEEPCRNCHDPNGDGVRLAGVIGGNWDPRPVNGCEICHGNGGNHFGLGPIDKYRVAASDNGSAQFNVCTRCHQLPGALGGEITPFHSGTGRRILDTHLGTPGFWGTSGSDANTKDITGYALNPLADSPCTICHNPHSASAVINRQWSLSRHAEKTAAGAWAHYNWSISSRASCQRCHTTTGVIAYLDFLRAAGSSVDPSKFVGPIAPDANFRPQMLQCNGCHSNNKGGLRNPGRVAETYADGAIIRYDDMGNSNLCLVCHVGRESGGSITAKTGNWGSIGFINSHYLSAGGTLFGTTGYEFTGINYDNVPFFLHDKIGREGSWASIDAVEGIAGTGALTGKQGPCISCHMSFNINSEKHTFLPLAVERNDPDHPLKITRVTDIRSTLCATCHRGAYALTVAEFEEQKTLLAEAMEAFDAQLKQRGYFWADSNPYFFKSAGNTARTNAVINWLSPFDADITGNTTGKNNMGAAFNFNLIEHDPGAFVHNRYYVKKLIYDSIDWLDDNILNNSVAATLDSATHAGKPYQAGAKAYILGAGGGRP
ncbi:MAG: hypothetical protein HZB33_14160 [Nitrospirae bacterium]|nr:hypothetical protein [Nitrospirota bacterium]